MKGHMQSRVLQHLKASSKEHRVPWVIASWMQLQVHLAQGNFSTTDEGTLDGHVARAQRESDEGALSSELSESKDPPRTQGSCL